MAQNMTEVRVASATMSSARARSGCFAESENSKDVSEAQGEKFGSIRSSNAFWDVGTSGLGRLERLWSPNGPRATFGSTASPLAVGLEAQRTL